MGNATTLWATPFGEYARQKTQGHTPAFLIGIGGIVAGVEANRDLNAFGVAGAYAFTHIHERLDRGGSNINQGFLSVYGTVASYDWHLDLALWGSYYYGNNRRKIAFPGVNTTAYAHIKGWQLAPHFELGYDGYVFKNKTLRKFGIGPFAMADCVPTWENKYQEHGSSGFNVKRKSHYSYFLRTETGFRLHEKLLFDWGTCIFTEKASYVYRKGFKTGRVTTSLVGSPGSFTVITLNSAQNLGPSNSLSSSSIRLATLLT